MHLLQKHKVYFKNIEKIYKEVKSMDAHIKKVYVPMTETSFAHGAYNLKTTPSTPSCLTKCAPK